MSYKPLSQTVTDGQKNPISSDAVNDHVAAEIAAIPAGASLTLDNLTAPTAVSQVLRGQDGTKDAPAYSFTSDPDTGMYRSANNQISFSVNNADIFRVTNGGNEASRSIAIRSGGNIDALQAGTFNLRLGWYSDSPATFLSQDILQLTVRDSLGLTVQESSQNFLNMKSFGIVTSATAGHLGGQNGAVSYRRFFTGSFRYKIAIGNMGPYGTYGGLFSGKGYELNLSGTSFVTTTGTNVIGHGSLFAGSTISAGPVRVAAMGTGDRIKLVKTGQPDLILTIIDEATSSVSDGVYSIHNLTVDQNVSTDYNNSTLVVLPPLIHLRTKDDAVVFDIDYEGKASLDTSLVINDSGADKDFRVEGDTDANLVFVDASADKVGIGTSTPAEKLEVSGNIKATSGDVSIATAGKGLKVAEGSNAKMGTATLSAGTFTVATTAVTNNSRIFLTVQSLGTVSDPKAIAVTGRTDGQDFTITSADNTDTSVVAWMIVEPA